MFKDIVMEMDAGLVYINALVKVHAQLEHRSTLVHLVVQAPAEVKEEIAKATVNGVDGIVAVEFQMQARLAEVVEEPSNVMDPAAEELQEILDNPATATHADVVEPLIAVVHVLAVIQGLAM